MTLQSSGQISFNNINTELGVAGTTQASLGQSTYRNLAGVPSGQISMSNFYGKSSWKYAGLYMLGRWDLYPGSVFVYIQGGQPGNYFRLDLVYNSDGYPLGTVGTSTNYLDGDGSYVDRFNIYGDYYWYPYPPSHTNGFTLYQRDSGGSLVATSTFYLTRDS